VDSANFSGTGPGAICGVFPNTATNCGTGFYCRSKSCPESIADGYDHCSAYAQQGAPCDTKDTCEQCEPGTQCTNGVCAASCASSQACKQACNGQFPLCIATGTNNGSVESKGNSQGSCYASCGSGVILFPGGHAGGACNAASPCCDLGNACAVPPQSGVALPSGTCCETPDSYTLSGIQCTSNGDCCAGYLCRQQGSVSAGGPSACVSCDSTNNNKNGCTADSQCCQASGYKCLPPTGASGPTTCQTCHNDATYCGKGSDCCSGNCNCHVCVPAGTSAGAGTMVCTTAQLNTNINGVACTSGCDCCAGTACGNWIGTGDTCFCLYRGDACGGSGPERAPCCPGAGTCKNGACQ